MYIVSTGPQQAHSYKHMTFKHATQNTNERTFSMDNYHGQFEMFSGKKLSVGVIFQ
jgi:hypothetical protein